MTSTRGLLITIFTVAGLALAAPALAAGGGGGDGGGGAGGAGGGNGGGGAGGNAGGTARGATPECPQGYVLERKSSKCVRVKAGILPDDELYAQGRAFALAGYYAEALPILEAISRTDDAMVYTMRGFATRKLGHFDEGMALYEKALAIDPNNVNTHEYKGEAYVLIGRQDLAREELNKVESGCGTTCEQYEDLAQAIETGKVE